MDRGGGFVVCVDEGLSELGVGSCLERVVVQLFAESVHVEMEGVVANSNKASRSCVQWTCIRNDSRMIKPEVLMRELLATVAEK